MSVYRKTRKDGSQAWYVDVSYRGIRHRFVAGSTKTQASRFQMELRDKFIRDSFERNQLENNR